MNKIRQGDVVQVLSGRDKGRRGRVSRVAPGYGVDADKVLVEGLNLVTTYVRPNPQKNEPGGIIKREALMPASKVAVVDPETNKPARVKIVTGEDGKKTRAYYVSENRRAAPEFADTLAADDNTADNSAEETEPAAESADTADSAEAADSAAAETSETPAAETPAAKESKE